MRPHRWQPTRLPRPWDSPGKNTGVGCHFLLQCMKVKGESEVAQSCLTLRDPMDCSLPGSSTHTIFQVRVLEWGAIAFSDTHTHTYILFHILSQYSLSLDIEYSSPVHSSVAKSCLILRHLMNCSTFGFSILHYLHCPPLSSFVSYFRVHM